MASNCNDQYFIRRDECPVCSSDRYKILYSCPMTDQPVRNYIDSHYREQGEINWQYLERTDYVICDCNDCKLIWQKHVPNTLMLDNIYNKMISPTALSKLERSRLTVDNFDKIVGELVVLFRMVAKHPTDIRMLDYGFGHARWARVAVAMGATVFGIELSPEKVSSAKNIGVSIISEAELSGMRFDLVHTEQVLEHLTDPTETFGRLARTFLPDGMLKISVPPQGNIRKLLNKRGMIDRSPQQYLWSYNGSLDSKSKDNDYVAISPLEHLNVFSATAIGLHPVPKTPS